MKKLDKPTLDPKDVFLSCISKVRNPFLKAKLESVAGAIESASLSYDVAANSGLLYQTPSGATVAGVVSKEEMLKVYSNRMAKKGQPGRDVYDKLKSLPEHGICPFCSQRTVSTLDHYLAKTHYPSLAVTPLNLVASCSDCNKEKLDSVSSCPENQIMHPYYDDVSDVIWLHALLVEEGAVTLRFIVQTPNDMDETLRLRIEHHFSSLSLGVLYTSHAASELVNQKAMLEKLFERGGASRVREQLEDSAFSYSESQKNSWQAAMYRSLSVSDWFCTEGFSYI